MIDYRTDEATIYELDGAVFHEEPPDRSMLAIARTVATMMRVDLDALFGPSQAQHIAWARHVAVYAVRQQCGYSYPTIGRFFGRDYSTVIHSCGRVRARMAESPGFADLVRGLLRQVQVGHE